MTLVIMIDCLRLVWYGNINFVRKILWLGGSRSSDSGAEQRQARTDRRVSKRYMQEEVSTKTATVSDTHSRYHKTITLITNHFQMQSSEKMHLDWFHVKLEHKDDCSDISRILLFAALNFRLRSGFNTQKKRINAIIQIVERKLQNLHKISHL